MTSDYLGKYVSEGYGFGNGCGQRSKLTVAVCVRLQLQNIEDELRGMPQTYTARSNEKSLRSDSTRVVKVREFPAKFRFCKQTGGTAMQIYRQFVTFSRSEQVFEQYLLLLTNGMFSTYLIVSHNY